VYDFQKKEPLSPEGSSPEYRGADRGASLKVSALIKLAESTPFAASRESFLPSTIHPQPSTISPARGRAGFYLLSTSLNLLNLSQLLHSTFF
jgi:hypothetical protein